MKIVDVLRAARAKIEKPENWTTGALARDELGGSIDSKSKDAVCWCSYGAIGAVIPREESARIQPALDALAIANNKYTFSCWQDNATHAEVLAAFDKAIAYVEARS